MDVWETKLIRLIEMIYCTVEDQALWPTFLRELSDDMQGNIAAIYVHDIESADGNCVWSVRVDPEYLRLYDEYYHSKNIWAIRAKNLLAPGIILMSHEVCPDAVVLKTEYYSDFLKPIDAFHNVGATILREGSMVGMLTVTRFRRAPHFEERDLGLLRALMPHLSRALQLQRRLKSLELRNATSGEMLDRLDVALFTVDRRGEVQVLNRAAQRLLEEGDGIHLEADGLKASMPSETAALRRIVSKTTYHATASGGSMLLSRKSSAYPLEVLVVPIRFYNDIFDAGRTSALVIVVDPGERPKISLEALRQLFGLSHAEANFARLLASGGSIKELADELGISMNTARTHLKKVLLKTGGRRQAEVVLRILRSSAVWQEGTSAMMEGSHGGRRQAE